MARAGKGQWVIFVPARSTRCRREDRSVVSPLGACSLVSMVAVSLATPFLFPEYYQRWFASSLIWYVAPVPVLTGIAFITLLRALAARHPWRAFLSALGIFALGMIGLGVSMYPHIVPPSVTIWDAAAPRRSQEFMIVGVAIILPLILGYTGWAYWVFRGKVGNDGYH